MEIKPFNQGNIDLVAEMAEGVWGKNQGAHGSAVARIFCQYLTRYYLYSADLALQAEDEDGMQAIAFAWLPGETNSAATWLRNQLPALTDDEQQKLLTNERYLMRTDEELLSKMLPSIEWLYLWTDSSCNWQYYPKHGFEFVGEAKVPEFSTDEEEYTNQIYRKHIKI